MKTMHAKRTMRGFSLMELMISLALFGLIASGALSLVMSGTRTQAHSARVDVAQSGLRAGLDFITRDILSASAGASTGALTLATSGTILQPIVVVDGGTGASDSIEIYSVDASYMGTVTASITNASANLPIVLSDASYPFAVGDVVQLCDFTKGVLVTLTSPVSSTTLNGSLAGLTTTFSPGSLVFKTRHVKYSIVSGQFNNTASGNGSALMMDLFDGAGGASNPQPLAEGVEDLQVALAVDADANGVIAPENAGTANADEWVLNNAGETAPLTDVGLKAVRVTLVAKSTTKEQGTFPARPITENHAAGTADGFFRRIVRSEVAVRNFNL